MMGFLFLFLFNEHRGTKLYILLAFILHDSFVFDEYLFLCFGSCVCVFFLFILVLGLVSFSAYLHGIFNTKSAGVGC